MRAAVLLGAVVLATAATVTGDAHACSCAGADLALLSPVNADAAPINTHVRIEAATGGLHVQSFVLRVHRGANVATQARTYPGAQVTLVELVPAAPLPPLTRFEVATIDPGGHPPTTVIGTFKTGSAPDTTPPQLRSLGQQRTRLNARFGGGDCSIRGPWVELANVVAQDERADAQLAYGVWAANAAGRLDTQRLPDTILFTRNGTLAIGQTSLCDPARFTFSGAVVTLAVAAMDEAGNTSRPLRLRADLTKNTP